MVNLSMVVGWAGVRIWMGWIVEEVCGESGAYVVAGDSCSGLTFPVNNYFHVFQIN